MSTAEATPVLEVNETTENTESAESKDEDYVDMTFTKEVRQATKDVHKLTDVLVNAKFAIGKCFFKFSICFVI